MKDIIRKILKEESLKQTLLDQIKQDGWLETAKLVGGVDTLLSIVGEETIINMLISCFKNLYVEKRGGGDVYLMDGGLPILEKKSSFWGLPLVAYNEYITSRINRYLDYNTMTKLFKKDVRRELIKELVNRFPELYVEDIDVYQNSGLYTKLDSFKL